MHPSTPWCFGQSCDTMRQPRCLAGPVQRICISPPGRLGSESHRCASKRCRPPSDPPDRRARLIHGGQPAISTTHAARMPCASVEASMTHAHIIYVDAVCLLRSSLHQQTHRQQEQRANLASPRAQPAPPALQRCCTRLRRFSLSASTLHLPAAAASRLRGLFHHLQTAAIDFLSSSRRVEQTRSQHAIV